MEICTFTGTRILLLQSGTAIVNASRSPAARIDMKAFTKMHRMCHRAAAGIEAIPAARRGASITLGIDTS
jgi:hypothetical protein